jgi:hypothetical protein
MTRPSVFICIYDYIGSCIWKSFSKK